MVTQKKVLLKLLELWTKACSTVCDIPSNLANFGLSLHYMSGTLLVSSDLALKLWSACLVGCMELYVMHASLNGLKVQDFAGDPNSESVALNFKKVAEVYELVATGSLITLQFMQYQLHSNGEYVRFFMKM